MARAYWGRFAPTELDNIKLAYDKLFVEPPSFVALDVETVSLKNRTVLGIGIGTPTGDNFYFGLSEPTLPWHLIWPGKTHKIYHNSTFDLSWEALGRFGADIDNIEDTAILTRLLNIDTELSAAAYYVDAMTWSMSQLLAEH